jgi:hypothetical protein
MSDHRNFPTEVASFPTRGISRKFAYKLNVYALKATFTDLSMVFTIVENFKIIFNFIINIPYIYLIFNIFSPKSRERTDTWSLPCWGL